MSDLRPATEAIRHAPFQARIASVALITTVAVLLAACISFMLQQWVVSRQESRQAEATLNAVVAEIAAPALANHDVPAAQRAAAAAAAAPAVVAATLVDSSGRIVAVHQDKDLAAKPGPEETVRTVVKYEGRTVGALVTTVRPPSLAALAPRYAALTLALFFGASGLALFLAQGLSRRVIAPVTRLSDAMVEVASSGKFTPVAEDADDDLFRNLARSFNHLLAKLDANDKDLRRTMGELVVARDQANEANVLKSQFLANMSHEIRTPLNGVLAMADVMAFDDMSEKQRERLGVIRKSGELLLAVINDVLDLSKIEAGRLELLAQDFSLDEMADSVRQAFEVPAAEKALDFAVEVEPEVTGYWRGDADRLRQIVGNLLSNAIKFTPEGQVRVRFHAAPRGGLRLSVTDTGIGIAPDKLPVLFDKFIQADNSTTRRFGGTGLGLAICRELAQLMGGSVTAKSIEGRGSSFIVELPLERAATPAPAEIAARAESDVEPRRMRVLAAEDNATNQKVLQAVMEPLDADLTIVPDGREAVDAWKIGAFDLILMDIQMPVMDGIEAARAIRAAETAEGRPRIPILALTANALVHQVEEYIAAGMDGHIAKPIELPRLYDAIERAFNAPRPEPQAAPGKTKGGVRAA